MFRLTYIVIVILVSFITSIRCDEIVIFMEGDEALLVFPFPCNSTKITLQYGMRYPFFDSTNPWVLSLPPGPQNRFQVYSTTEGSSCMLNLNIVPVTRDDAGTYILLAYTNEYITRVWLDVEFLPGLPSCKMVERHAPARDWWKLTCQATVGSMVGQIQCYQNGMEMPPISQPYESSRMLEQTILVKENSHLVFCCSSPAIEPKERCDCKDFAWDPSTNEESSDTVDPCPSTTPVYVTTNPHSSPHFHDDNSSSPPATVSKIISTTDRNNVDDNPFKKRFVIILVVIFVMLIVLLVRYLVYSATSKFDTHARSNAKREPLLPI